MVLKASKETIIWRLPVQSSLQASNNTGILNTCTWLWLMESEQVTPVDSIKDVVRSSVKVPEFNKHLKKAGGHIGRNVVEITIKMKTIVRKPLMIKINKLRFRNLDNYFSEIQLIFAIKQFQTKQNLHLCKKILKNTFLRKHSIYWMTIVYLYIHICVSCVCLYV